MRQENKTPSQKAAFYRRLPLANLASRSIGESKITTKDNIITSRAKTKTLRQFNQIVNNKNKNINK